MAGLQGLASKCSPRKLAFWRGSWRSGQNQTHFQTWHIYNLCSRLIYGHGNLKTWSGSCYIYIYIIAIYIYIFEHWTLQATFIVGQLLLLLLVMLLLLLLLLLLSWIVELFLLVLLLLLLLLPFFKNNFWAKVWNLWRDLGPGSAKRFFAASSFASTFPTKGEQCQIQMPPHKRTQHVVKGMQEWFVNSPEKIAFNFNPLYIIQKLFFEPGLSQSWHQEHFGAQQGRLPQEPLWNQGLALWVEQAGW